jgi:RNA polymerase sigma factor (sigma-70 family)
VANQLDCWVGAAKPRFLALTNGTVTEFFLCGFLDCGYLGLSKPMDVHADSDLLQSYAAARSEAAFTELVRRQIDFVYGSALRRVGGDAHLAEDVTQRVFVALARDAAGLARHPVLAGWLFTTTRNLAAQTVRSERRRRAREQEVHAMNVTSGEDLPPPDWEKLRPELDEAMDQLGESDREAVLLRFFSGTSFAEIGGRLRLTENAARMRVERALEKMQATLARRGVTSTAAALGLALSGQASFAAPLGLAAAVTGGAMAAGLAVNTAGSAAVFMSMNKIGMAAVALIVGGTVGIFWQRQENAPLRNEVAELRPQVQELARVRTENARLAKSVGEIEALRAEHDELEHLRGEVAVLKKETVRLRAVAAATPPSATNAGAQPRIVPISAARNVGQSTPQAAAETLGWALQNGEIELLANLVTFEPDARAKMQELVARLPENVREKYDSPEKLLALAAAGGSKITSVQILSEQEDGPDDFRQHLQFFYGDGSSRVDNIHFHRDSDGWRQVLTINSALRVEAALRQPMNRAAPAK